MGTQPAGLLQRPGVPKKPPPSESRPALLTVKQAARAMNAHPQTVRDMLERGDLRGERVGRVWRISRKALSDRYDIPDDYDFGAP